MVAVKEITWEEAAAPDFGTARAAWRAAVSEIALKAKDTLPECHGRVDSAVKIVLAGDVEILPEGKAKVASQSNGTTAYFVVNGGCECKDFAKAPSGWCKHRIAAGLYKRASALARAKLDTPATGQAESLTPPAQPQAEAVSVLPEAPASCNVYVTLAGRKVQVTLRDTDEQHMLARLETLLQRFPAEADGEQEPQEGWCSTHGAHMKLNHKDGRSWWSHRTADGWCKGK